MKRYVVKLCVYLHIGLMVSCIQNNQESTSQQSLTTSKRDSALLKIMQCGVRSKDLDEEIYLKSFSEKEINRLYGEWILTDISNIGEPSFLDSLSIKEIGTKLTITKDYFSFESGGITIKNPTYKLNSYDKNYSERDAIAKTFYWGYRPNRENIYELAVNKSTYFEIIYYSELAYYANSQFFFFKKIRP
ncbi:hypothetical protein QNI19_38610 [Cytophagaceae bacterium DM2B3-1]|uniref:DUF4488 domain-containing protein n=1 Tax=Xanthocytophaga flava TaxID=3048013 RepID=A0ABT7CYP7_9BACT|nr:hypothetical protein [Xanthocytophaga flavus]MDJ1498904.1 hypothetical protein [Xanthocytophaga flavus]